MNSTRTGKIARLPLALREQLNHRLQNAEPGDTLLEWLNALPEVQTLLQEQFAGSPINKQNLSDWRLGGFADWEFRQEFLEDVRADTEDLKAASAQIDQPEQEYLADSLATVLAGRYASLLVHWDGEVTAAFTHKLRALSSLCRDITALRRSHQNGRRLELAQEKQAAQLKPKPKRAPEPPMRDFDTVWNESEQGYSTPEPPPTLIHPSPSESRSVKPGQAFAEPALAAGVGTACPHNSLETTPTPTPTVIPHSSFCLPPSPAGSRSVKVSQAFAEPPTATPGVGTACPHIPAPAPSDLPPSPEASSSVKPSQAFEPSEATSAAPAGILHSSFCLLPSFDNTLHDPDPQSYPSYDQYMKTCVHKPKKPVIPPLRQTLTRDDAPF